MHLCLHQCLLIGDNFQKELNVHIQMDGVTLLTDGPGAAEDEYQ